MLYFNIKVFSDSAEKWQLSLQDTATPMAEGLLFFHNYLMFFLIAIGVFISYLLYEIISKFSDNSNSEINNFAHNSLLEFIWTLVPAIILLFISVPSFALLYSLDELIEPALTLKVIGHQWYWSYEYTWLDMDNQGKAKDISFDSYMIDSSDLKQGGFRLLEVDNRVVLPTKTHIRVLVTSSDVIHSWAIPSFGIKIDACPGRLTQGSFLIKRPGTFFGQCSEICGINHGFMPIVVKAVTYHNFLKWAFIRQFDIN